MPPSRADLQAELVDRFCAGTGSYDIALSNPVVCQVTGRCPTLLSSMTSAECQAALNALDAKAQAKADARELAQKNELLRLSGRYGVLMADDTPKGV